MVSNGFLEYGNVQYLFKIFNFLKQTLLFIYFVKLVDIIGKIVHIQSKPTETCTYKIYIMYEII